MAGWIELQLEETLVHALHTREHTTFSADHSSVRRADYSISLPHNNDNDGGVLQVTWKPVGTDYDEFVELNRGLGQSKCLSGRGCYSGIKA